MPSAGWENKDQFPCPENRPAGDPAYCLIDDEVGTLMALDL
jgi:hypothetical protein